MENLIFTMYFFISLCICTIYILLFQDTKYAEMFSYKEDNASKLCFFDNVQVLLANLQFELQ